MIDFITYHEKQYPVRISHYVLEMTEKESKAKKQNLEELDNNEYDLQRIMLWYALVAGHHMAQQELTLTREDVIWVIDECYTDFLRILYESSQAIIKFKEELVNTTEDKKK